MRMLCRLTSWLVISMAAWAADPFVGHWKLDAQKSVFMDGSKAIDGGITYEPTRLGYTFHEVTIFDGNQVAQRRGPVQFGAEKRLADRVVASTSKIDDRTYEVVYANTLSGRLICVFRYVVYPQIRTLIAVAYRGDNEKPIQTLVYDKLQ